MSRNDFWTSNTSEKMTRRALLLLESYGCTGKLGLEWSVENVGKPITKMKISHYSQVRLTPDQSPPPEVETYPDMTRRAFSALRVIRLKGKLPSRMALNFSGILTRKMVIAQNL